MGLSTSALLLFIILFLGKVNSALKPLKARDPWIDI